MICEIRLTRRVDLRTPDAETLSPAELRRLERYAQAADRSRYLTGAALLRRTVAEWLGIPAQAVMVDRTCPGCGDQHGPPRLPGTELHASVSHSGDVVAVAVTDAGPVGIDVEEIGVLDYARLMQDVCAEDERPFVDGAVAFYAYWTRKEAFLKATTEGLTRRMADIVVSPPKLPPAILDVRNGPTPPTRMRDLSVEGYSATAAVLTSGTVRWVVRQDDLRSTVRGRTEGAHDGDGTPQSDYDDERDGAGERADRGRG